jgi:hypothetical protein
MPRFSGEAVQTEETSKPRFGGEVVSDSKPKYKKVFLKVFAKLKNKVKVLDLV